MSAPTFSRGFERGVTAFADGRGPVPALDPYTLASLDGVTIGGAVEYLRGWSAGWHSANLLAPLPDDACAHDSIDALNGAVWCEDCGAELDSFDEELAR